MMPRIYNEMKFLYMIKFAKIQSFQTLKTCTDLHCTYVN